MLEKIWFFFKEWVIFGSLKDTVMSWISFLVGVIKGMSSRTFFSILVGVEGKE